MHEKLVSRWMGKGHLCLLALTVLAFVLGSVATQAQVLINGTTNATTLFGVQPPRPLTFVANQTAGGAISMPSAQPQYFNSTATTNFTTGVVLTFMNQRAVTQIGPGVLAPGHMPGGAAQPVTFAPPTIHPGTTLPVSPANMRAGYRSATGAHFGGALAVAGFEVNQGLFQTSPAFLIRQRATRPNILGGAAGTAPSVATGYTPMTTLLDLSQSPISPPFSGSEARHAFPWTTGSISVVALIGPAVPYGGAGAIGLGTSLLPTSPINFRTIAGFDGRVLNTAVGTLTGNLQLVSPVVQNAAYALTGQDSIAAAWELDLTVVPEPSAVAALAAGLLLVAGLAVRQARR